MLKSTSNPTMSLDDLQLSPHVAATSTDAPSSPGEFAAFQLGIAMTDTGGASGFHPNATTYDTSTARGRLPVKPEKRDNIEGLSTILVVDPTTLCRGRIGETGLKFCIDNASCNIVSHQNKRINLVPGLYTREKGTNTAFTQPVLNVDRLDSEVTQRLLSSTESLSNLQEEISLIEKQSGTTDLEINQHARKVLRQAMDYKTPSKALKSSAQELNPSNLTELTSIILQTKALAKSNLNVKNEDEVKEDTLNRLIPNFAGAVDSLETDVNTQENLINGSILRLHQLTGKIGEQSSYLQNNGYPSIVWDSIAHTVEEVEMNRRAQQNWGHNIEDEIKSLKASLQQLIAKPTVNSSLDPQLSKLLFSWKQSIENIAHRLTTIEKEHKAPQSSTAVPTIDPFQTFNIGNIGNVDTSIQGGLTEAVEALSQKVGKLESQQSEVGKDSLTGAVQFGGYTFAGPRDVENWLENHLDSSNSPMDVLPPYGLFADPHLLLHWIWVVISGSSNTSAREMRDRSAIALTQDKIYAIDSFQHYVPLIFSGKRISSLINTGGMEKSRLPQIPTFKDWDDASGQHGLKQQINETLRHVKESLAQLIQDTFANNPELRAFTSSMMHASISFIEGVSIYMSETFNNFKDVVGDSKSVWGLVTYVVEQLFKRDFGQVRAKTIGAIDANNKSSAVKMIWSAIRSVGVSQDLMANGIKNAPAVSASYVRFVLMHSNMGKVSSLIEENKSLKRKHEELEQVVKEIKKTADNAKKVADQAMSRVTSKKKRGQEEVKEN